MSTIKQHNRRAFLKYGLAGLGAAAAAPYIWVPRISKAALDIPNSRHNHVIIINLDGGCRSVPMFNGALDTKWNPYGTLAGAPGTEWGVGAVFDETPYPETTTAFGMAMPSLPQISNEIAVIGTVDHTPGAPAGEGNHEAARNWISSGKAEGGPGIMSLVYAMHKNYTEGSAGLVFPSVTIGTGNATTPFSKPMGTISPVEVPSFAEFAQQSGDDAGGQPDWARDFEAGLDEHAIATRGASDKIRLARVHNGKKNVKAFRNVFLDPALRVAEAPTAGNELTNAELQAIFGTTQLGRNMALALRFIQYGSAAVTVGYDGWDTHSNEMGAYTTSANELARAFAGLSFALKRMTHPETGASMWDHTLIMVQSEFGRDNLMGSGYNSGGGSDHTGGPGSRFQAFPYLGGLVTQGGKMFGRTDANTMEPLAGEPIYSTTQHMAMALAVLDINIEEVYPGIDPMNVIFTGVV